MKPVAADRAVPVDKAGKVDKEDRVEVPAEDKADKVADPAGRAAMRADATTKGS